MIATLASRRWRGWNWTAGLITVALLAMGPFALGLAQAAPAKGVIDKLFDPDNDDPAFYLAYVAAKQAGAPDEILFEARLSNALNDCDEARLAKLLPEGEYFLPKVDLAQSHLFSSAPQAQAMLFGLRAVAAREKNDKAGFNSNLQQAYYTYPAMSPTLMAWSKEFYDGVPLKQPPPPILAMNLPIAVSDGTTTTLAAQVKGKKAILLDFWASWCGPCMANMPELESRGKILPPQGIAVAGMNEEADVKVAAQVKAQLKMTIPWLVEPASQPYSGPLGIDTIPRAVLVTPAGKVLFNGHPLDPGLPLALVRVGAKM